MFRSLKFIHDDHNLKKALKVESSSLNYIKILNQEKITQIKIFRQKIEIQKKELNFSLNEQFYEKLIPELNCISAKISRQARLVKSALAYYVIGELVRQNKNELENFNEKSFVSFSKFLFDFTPSLKNLNKMGIGTNKSNYTFNESDFFKEKNSAYFLWFHDEYRSYKEKSLLSLVESRNEFNILKKDLEQELVDHKIHKALHLLFKKRDRTDTSYY